MNGRNNVVLNEVEVGGKYRVSLSGDVANVDNEYEEEDDDAAEVECDDDDNDGEKVSGEEGDTAKVPVGSDDGCDELS